MLMLRGSKIHPWARILVPLLLTVPAYIIYVPVCTFSAMFTTSFLGSKGYGPTFPGMLLASIIAFVGVLLCFAAILRYRFKRPLDDAEALSFENSMSDSGTPDNELPHE
jgi:hypothetical protein